MEVMTDEDLLTLVDQQIAALLSGGAVQSWRDGQNHAVEHMSLGELRDFKNDLQNQIAQAGGGMLLPIREVNV